MNEQAIPKNAQMSNWHQQTLDASLTPKVPQFTKAGLMDYIVELIVSEDEAFQFVDKGPFHRLLQYLCPSLSDNDIPHCTKTWQEILDPTRFATGCVKETLAHVDSKISITFDSWTSFVGDPFLSVTAHYIDSPINKPQEWKLKMEQLAFRHIKGNHSSANIGRILVEVIDEYGIRKKVCFSLLLDDTPKPMHVMHSLVGSPLITPPTTILLSELLQMHLILWVCNGMQVSIVYGKSFKFSMYIL